MGLHDEFDNEQDLSASFDKEGDLHDSFDKEDDMHASGDKELAKNKTLWDTISGAAGDVYDKTIDTVGKDSYFGKVLEAPVALSKLPGFIKREGPKEWARVKDNPAQAGEAGLKKFTQGASLVTIPEDLKTEAEKTIAGYAKHLPESLGGISDEQYNDLYNRPTEDISAQNKQHDAALQEKFPITSLVGQGLGYGTTAATMGAAGVPGLAAAAIPAGTQTASKVLEEGGTGEQALKEGGKDAAVMATLDLLTGGAINLVKKGAGAVTPGALRNAATNQTLKSIGASDSAISGMRQSPEAVAEQLHQSGIISPLKTKTGMRATLEDTLTSEGKNLEKIVKGTSKDIVEKNPGAVKDTIAEMKGEADQAITDWLRQKGQSDYDPAMFDVQQRLGRLDKLGQSNYDVNGQLLKTVDNAGGVTEEATQLPTFEQLHQFKQDLGNEVRWNRKTDNVHQQALEKLYDLVDTKLDNLAAGQSKVPLENSPYKLQNDKLSRLYSAKGAFPKKGSAEGVMETVQDAIKKSPSTWGPLAYLGVKAAGAAGLGPVGVAAVTLPAIAAAKFGRQALSQGLRGAANVTEGAAELLTRVSKASPETLGQFAKPIAAAAERGPQAVAATNYLLSQQYPEYRDLINKLQGGKK